MRVLVVEDDAKLVRVLQRGLALEGYRVELARDGQEGLARGTAEDLAAVVLDLGLPGLDGLVVCRELRARGCWVPVLMLTARAQVEDRIRGLDGGADDYLVKPFDFGELLARLRVLVRRGPAPSDPVLALGDLRLHLADRLVTRGGRQVELTPREFDVLEVLARAHDRTVTREDLQREVWQQAPDVSPNIADVYVGYLRRKLETPGGPRLIHTVRGRGWALRTGR